MTGVQTCALPISVEPAKVRPHNLFDLPMLCESGGKALAITEAGLSDYAGLYLTGRGDGGPVGSQWVDGRDQCQGVRQVPSLLEGGQQLGARSAAVGGMGGRAQAGNGDRVTAPFIAKEVSPSAGADDQIGAAVAAAQPDAVEHEFRVALHSGIESGEDAQYLVIRADDQLHCELHAEQPGRRCGPAKA